MAKFHFEDGTFVECLDRDAPKKSRILCRYHGARVEADDATWDAVVAILPGEPPIRYEGPFGKSAPAEPETSKGTSRVK